MGYQTQEEIRLAKGTAMGNDLRELHFQLGHEVVWLHFKWNEYRAFLELARKKLSCSMRSPQCSFTMWSACPGEIFCSISGGRRPELVGGSGSVGESFAVKSQRRRRTEESTDERILSSGAFVERVLKEADARTLRQNAFKKTKRYAERVVAALRKKDGISLTELRSGSRRGKLPAVRVKIVQGLVEDYGVPIAEVARQVGISTSGVSKILTRSLSS